MVCLGGLCLPHRLASMKVPPKRKGKSFSVTLTLTSERLNESPSEKEGKPIPSPSALFLHWASMKVPPKRKGNVTVGLDSFDEVVASMKVPPKRKGKFKRYAAAHNLPCLNESPSEKEGKRKEAAQILPLL